jgi:hypothetical protein
MLNNEDVKMLDLGVILVVTFSTNQSKKNKKNKTNCFRPTKGEELPPNMFHNFQGSLIKKREVAPHATKHILKV